MEAIHAAAMKSSLHDVSDLIIKYAKRMTGVKNARIRFVDYTGNRLVAGALAGICEEYPMMAIRSFHDCVVGRVARNLQTERVENIKVDDDFKKFLTCIENKGKVDFENNIPGKLWESYARSLRTLKSEIAVPITVAKIPEVDEQTDQLTSAEKKLIGVMNVNSVTTTLSRKHEKILNDFGSTLSLTFLNRRSFLLERLHNVEKDMMSVCSWDEMGRQIVKGLHKIVAGSIPNIYLFDENKKENPFEFLFAAGATKEEEELGNFSPRWKDPRGKGIGELAIERRREGKDAFVVVEDVQNDSIANDGYTPCDSTNQIDDKNKKEVVRASKRAKDLGVRTVGCLPLEFHGEIVGVLYLHFKQSIHFFTEEEKTILEMFALSAAIAIKNVSTTPSFKELSGNMLINYILNYQSDGNSEFSTKILIQLQDVTKKLENSKGTSEIVKLINKGITDIGNTLNMPNELFDINSRFQKYEEMILYKIPNYRDHFLHMFFVFSIGFLIINEWKEKKIPIFKINTEDDLKNLIKSWFICSIMHDVAYPLSDVKKWLPQFPKEALGLPNNIIATFDWTPFVLSDKTYKSIEAISNRFIEKCYSPLDKEKKRSAFRLWFLGQLLKVHDHGALGALTILNINWNDSLRKNATDAALAVALHNYIKDVNIPLKQIEIKCYPLAFLLTYCDAVQEWGRPTGNVNEDTKISNIIKKVFFENLIVNPLNEDNSTTIFLIYDPEKKIDAEVDENHVDSIITEKIVNNINLFTMTWSKKGIPHEFNLQVDKKNMDDPLCHYPIP